jgi:hypothetical protein
MESACSSSDLETWISLRPAVSLTQGCTLQRYHTWPQTLFLRYCLQWVCNFSGLFYLLYFLSSRFVSILQSFISLSLYRSQSLFPFTGHNPFLLRISLFSSCECPFSSCHILTSSVAYVYNKLFQVLALFCIVINYRRRIWSSANCRRKIGEN